MTLWKTMKAVMHRVIPYTSIEQALDVRLAVAPEDRAKLELWRALYENHPPWRKAGEHTTGAAGLVASELARMVTVEMEAHITGSARADALDAALQQMLSGIREAVETGCAKGGVVFKPFLAGGALRVGTVEGDAFYPIACDGSGRVTDAAFAQREHRDGVYYTKLERQRLDGSTLTITNTVYRSRHEGALGTRAALGDIPCWADVPPSAQIVNVDRPLFGYFRVPHAGGGALGASVYARAIDALKDADEQYNRVRWEYKGSELAIDADETLFRRNPRTGCVAMPTGFERLFRLHANGNEVKMQAWAPTIRDESLFRGLDRWFQRIEDLCGLARGTISDQHGEAKTATELKILRQRSYSTVTDLQKALETALQDTVAALDVLASVYGLAPPGAYELHCRFDDAVITDAEAQRETDRQDVRDGLMQKWEYRVKWYGEDEETAKAMCAGAAQPDAFGFGGC